MGFLALEGVRLLAGGSGEIDKKSDPMLTHLLDGAGYYVSKEFPIVRQVVRQYFPQWADGHRG